MNVLHTDCGTSARAASSAARNNNCRTSGSFKQTLNISFVHPPGPGAVPDVALDKRGREVFQVCLRDQRVGFPSLVQRASSLAIPSMCQPSLVPELLLSILVCCPEFSRVKILCLMLERASQSIQGQQKFSVFPNLHNVNEWHRQQ